MKPTRSTIIPVGSLLLAAAAQALGYGFAFAATSIALQVPLLVLIWAFAAVTERRRRRKAFLVSAVAVSLIFALSGIEDLCLCGRWGVGHSSDSGWAALGIRHLSAAIFVIYAIGFIVFCWCTSQMISIRPATLG